MKIPRIRHRTGELAAIREESMVREGRRTPVDVLSLSPDPLENSAGSVRHMHKAFPVIRAGRILPDFMWLGQK
jgi:hypothetical protein